MVPNKTTLSSGATCTPDHWLQIQKFPQPLSFSNSLEDSQNSGRHHVGSIVFLGERIQIRTGPMKRCFGQVGGGSQMLGPPCCLLVEPYSVHQWIFNSGNHTSWSLESLVGVTDRVRLPWWFSWKRIHLQCGRPGFKRSLGWEDPWRKEWLPTPVVLLGNP